MTAAPASSNDRPKLIFGVVMLGAGRSQRMGRPKLLLPWAGTTVLGHLLRQWKDLGAAQTLVVIAPQHELIGRELDRLGHPVSLRVCNPDADQGMFSSIQHGARWAGWEATLTHWAVVLGDQPHLKRETLSALLAFGATHSESICQPSWEGRRSHPVLLPRRVFAALKESEARTFKDFLGSYRAASWPAADPGLALDLDYPEDYETALRLYSAGTDAPEKL